MYKFSMNYFLADGHFEAEDESQWEVNLGGRPWAITAATIGGLFFLFLIWIGYEDSAFRGSIALGLALLTGWYLPLKARLSLNFLSGQFGLEADYLLRLSERHVEKHLPLQAIFEARLVKVFGMWPVWVDLLLSDGSWITLWLFRNPAAAQRLVQRLQARLAARAHVVPEDAAIPAFDLAKLRSRQLKFWGLCLAWLGLVKIVPGGWFLFPFWEAAAVGAGLAAFLSSDISLFVIFGMILLGTMYSNWQPTSEFQHFWEEVLQGGMAALIFREFHQFRKAELSMGNMLVDVPLIGKIFPWVALIAGVCAWIFIGTGLGIMIWAGQNGVELISIMPIAGMSIMPGLGCGSVAFALGLGSWICGYKYRPAAIMGCLMGVLPVIAWWGFVAFSSLR